MAGKQPKNRQNGGLVGALERRFGFARTVRVAAVALGVPVRTVQFWCSREERAIPFGAAERLRDKGVDLSGLPVDRKETRGRPVGT